MSNEESPTESPKSRDIEDLSRRINALRTQNDKEERKNHGIGDGEKNQGVAQAFRVGAELVSGLIVGVGIGWALDQWLGTTPWLLLVFFFLGAGAGILNVYRGAGLIGAKNDENASKNVGNNGKKPNNITESNDLDK